MSIIIEPHISNKRNRLRAFNENENIVLHKNEASLQETEQKDFGQEITFVNTTLSSTLEIIENAKKDISPKEGLSHHKEKKGISSTKSYEFNNNQNDNEKKLVLSVDGKKKDEKSLGFSTRLSTMWEDVKRMMGFSPDCLNGGYRSIGSRSCTCPQYFEGQLCEQIICANGGTRIKEKTTGFGGIQIEEDICKCTHPIYITGRNCEQVNCQNGGRLLSDGNCQCADGWYSGNFCQYYTSSWLVAIGIPLLFIALVIFCCVVCRMDLCSLCRQRSSVNTQRMRQNDRRSRRRQHQQNCPNAFGDCRQLRAGQNRSRRSNDNSSNVPRRQQYDEHLQNLYSQQNLLNSQHQDQQQYVLRLERFPMLYNPNCIIDKPLDPPPPYEQAILCVPTPIFGVSPNYYNYMTQQQSNDVSVNQNILTVQEENVDERNENVNEVNEDVGEEILEEREDENNIQEENNQQRIQQPSSEHSSSPTISK